jgi:hypothetical protein
MPDPRDYKLDIAALHDAAQAAGSGDARPFLSVRFACCNVYNRIYRNAGATRYEGRCPRCGRPARFLVGDGGTDARFFVVD